MSDSSEVAVALIEAGADVDAKNEGEETPLHVAAKEGNTKWVDFAGDQGHVFLLKDVRFGQ